MNNSVTSRELGHLVAALLTLSCCMAGSIPVPANAQLLYSFESGLDGFTLLENGKAIDQSTLGATEGMHSMAVETSPSWTWDTRVNHAPGEANYDAFNAVAADLGVYTLDFDVTLTEASWENVTTASDTYFYINMAVNSTLGWKQAGGAFRCTGGVTGTFPTSVQVTDLPISQDSTYYQLNLGSSSNFIPGPNDEGVVYYIDNIRFSRIPVYTEDRLFSWETPDDPGTPEINEQFEGWTANGIHNHSITTTGATDGMYALQIDRLGTSGFTWGSEVEISGGEGTPEQAIIDDLVERAEAADRIAFDVTWNDPFPASPTYLQFSMSLSDNTDWFQTTLVSLSPPAPTEETTYTVEFALADFMTTESNPEERRSLADVGFAEGTDFLRLAISSQTDDGGIYQIDNIRLLTEVLPFAADFNGDGTVNGLDLSYWMDGFGMATDATLEDGDADGDDDVDGNDFLIWQTETSGSGSSLVMTAVPEPSSLWLVALFGSFSLTSRFFKRRNR